MFVLKQTANARTGGAEMAGTAGTRDGTPPGTLKTMPMNNGTICPERGKGGKGKRILLGQIDTILQANARLHREPRRVPVAPKERERARGPTETQQRRATMLIVNALLDPASAEPHRLKTTGPFSVTVTVLL